MYRKLALLALGVSCLALSACEEDETGPDQQEFVAQLAPPAGITSSASGTATFVEENGVVDFTIRGRNLQDVFASHIHVGAAGENGPVAVSLFGTSQDAAVDVADGVFAEGSFIEADIVAATGLTFADLLARMESGAVYVNVHTLANRGGEIRGQILAR